VLIVVFSLVVLVFCWAYGDVQPLTKVIFTLLYVASVGLLFIPEHGYLFIVAHCALIAVVGGATFGLDWLTKDRWGR
jgi:hypothetical protein